VQVEEEEEAVGEPIDEPTIEVGPALAQARAAAHDHPAIHAKGLDTPRAPQGLSYSAPSEDGDVEVTGVQQVLTDDRVADVQFAGASRNAECPCGSGKKYKKCHGAPGGPTGLTTRVNG
jgi:preprotein translocase subunit SecA